MGRGGEGVKWGGVGTWDRWEIRDWGMGSCEGTWGRGLDIGDLLTHMKPFLAQDPRHLSLQVFLVSCPNVGSVRMTLKGPGRDRMWHQCMS